MKNRRVLSLLLAISLLLTSFTINAFAEDGPPNPTIVDYTVQLHRSGERHRP